jgi:hypothetical protein
MAWHTETTMATWRTKATMKTAETSPCPLLNTKTFSFSAC